MSSKLIPLRDNSSIVPALIFGFRVTVFTSLGRDTNPLQISSQQTLVLIYLLWKDRKLKMSHKYLNIGRAGDQTWDLVVRRQRSYQLRQPCPHNEVKGLSIIKEDNPNGRAVIIIGLGPQMVHTVDVRTYRVETWE